ncbi:MAG: DUF4388 domain-containing protein [Nitrospirae bacterium]|nr:DUF4388 domain-containing protein [Nitrospirota bacterium]
MALEGNIRDFGLTDIFQLISIQRKTGVLAVEGDEDAVQIAFRDGMIVGAESDRKYEENRLGMVLVRSGMVADEQVRRALEVQKETRQKLGNILLVNQVISKAALKEALQLQMEETIYKIFRWRKGVYRFNQETVDYDPELITPVDPQHILMDGIRMIDEWPFIEKKIPSLGMVFRLRNGALDRVVRREDPDEEDLSALEHAFLGQEGSSTTSSRGDGDKIHVTPDEERVLLLIDGEKDVSTIVDASRLGEFTVCKTLANFRSYGLIEEVEQRPRIKLEAEVRGFRELARSVTTYGVVFAVGLLLLLFLAKGERLFSLLSPSEMHALHEVMARSQLDALAFQIQVYRASYGRYPPTLGMLVEEGNLGSADIQDPWGREFAYRPLAGGFELLSFGQDGTEGSGDDIRR